MAQHDSGEVREMARWALKRFMYACSEARTCRSWADDNAYVLWRDVLEAPDARPAPSTPDHVDWQADAQRLRSLARLAGGWYHFSAKTHRVVFIGLPEWRAQYAAVWEQGHPTRSLARRLLDDAAEAEAIRARLARER